MNTLLGTKLDMTSRFDKSGKRLTLTRVGVETNYVVEKKETDKAGYNGVVLGYGKRKHGTKALLKKVSAIGHVPMHIKEIRTDDAVETGSQLKVSDVFAVGDLVKVSGVTKGRGFTGVVKRYNFRGGPKTHGQSDRHRAPGSLGSGTTPGRVFKGKRMAGRSGGENVTVRNLIVTFISPEADYMLLSGPVPGHRNTLLTITKIGENKNFSGIEELSPDAANIVAEPVVEETPVETAPEESAAPAEVVESSQESDIENTSEVVEEKKD